MREILARAEDFAEKWVLRHRSEFEREWLVSQAVEFVEVAMCDLGSKALGRLSECFEGAIEDVLLTTERKMSRRRRIAPMTALDEEALHALEQQGLTADDGAAAQDEQDRQDLHEAIRRLKGTDPRVHDILRRRLNDEKNSSIGERWGMKESNVRRILKQAQDILKEIVRQRRLGDDGGTGE